MKEYLNYALKHWRTSVAYFVLAMAIVVAFARIEAGQRERRQDVCQTTNSVTQVLIGLIELQGPPPTVPENASAPLEEFITEHYNRQEQFREQALFILDNTLCSPEDLGLRNLNSRASVDSVTTRA